MFSWKLLILVFLSILNANCRVQKALKPANFEADVPKFTPFEHDEIFENKARHLKTTESSTSPSPSAETLTKKISSRIKMPEKYVAELSKVKDVRKISNDFGSFDFKKSDEEPQKEEAQQILSEDEKHSHGDEEEKIDEEIEVTENQNSTLFKVGQLLNVTVDSEDDTVNVNLDHRALQDIFTGRGDKKSGLSKFLPLFILPFLIQSAVLPFMVAKIKLLLMKSLFAGKLAIMLFLLGALKTHSGNGYSSKSYRETVPFLLNSFPTPFLPDKRVQENVYEENEYQKKAEPFVRSLHA